MKDKIFMSYKRKRIWYRVQDGKAVYMVAKGDGTDEIFLDWQDAVEWIDQITK